MERMRAGEATAARDVIAQHLTLACKSIREKSAIIDTLRQQNKYLEDILKEHSSTFAFAPATPTSASQSERPPPAGQEASCATLVDGSPKAENSARKDLLSSDVIAEEEPPKYEVTEAFSQVGELEPTSPI
jgi:hypothetical protein